MSVQAEAEALVHELFRTEEGRRDPHPRLHRLRRIAPVHRSETAHAWLLTRYEDCRSALRDPRFGKRFTESLDEHVRGWRERDSLAWFARTMLQLDAPSHTRLRKKAAGAFTPRRVEQLRSQVEAIVAEILEEATRDDVDLLESLAFRLPITVIGDLLGIERAALPSFRQPTLDLTLGLEVRTTKEARAAADEAFRVLDEAFTQLFAQRRAQPGDDLLSALVGDEADPLSDRELNDIGILLLVAGFETTTNTISAGLLTLHDQPEQLAILRSGAHPDRVADEFLRLHSAVGFINRVALEDIEVGGIVIPEGDTVFAMLGAANRDPEIFDDPDRLDFTRERPKHLTFGGGVHHCLGAALARLELDVLLEQLPARFNAVEMPGERPRYRDTLGIRAMETLPLKLRPASAPRPEGAVARARPSNGSEAAWRDDQRRRLEEAPPELSPEELTQRVALLESQPLFAGLRPSALVSLATTAYVLAFEPGEHIVTQGATSEDVHLILEGEAVVRIDGEEVALLSADDLVGERGVVTGTPRAATVTATSHVSTLVMSRARFREQMDSDPAAAATMLAVTAARYPDGRVSEGASPDHGGADV